MDQFAWWRAARAAKQQGFQIPALPETPEGQMHRPESGYFRKRTSVDRKPCWEAIAFYRDGEEIVCERQFGRLPKDGDEMWDLFASVTREPVAYATYVDVVHHGKSWPDEVDAFGLPPLDDETPENERAVVGHNNPPADATEDQKAAFALDLAEKTAAAWLKDCDVTKLSMEEGDYLSRLAARIRELKLEHDKRRKELVEPHVKAQREINGIWNPLIERADRLARKLLGQWDMWRQAKQREAEAEARRVNEEARRKAEEERAKQIAEAPDAVLAETEPAPVVPLVQPVKIKGATGTRISSRTRTVFNITDLPALAAHIAGLENPPEAFVKACQAYANAHGPTGKIPGVTPEQVRNAG